jgi:hypothetical protein
MLRCPASGSGFYSGIRVERGDMSTLSRVATMRARRELCCEMHEFTVLHGRLCEVAEREGIRTPDTVIRMPHKETVP